jgi:transcription elongation factor Elf1
MKKRISVNASMRESVKAGGEVMESLVDIKYKTQIDIKPPLFTCPKCGAHDCAHKTERISESMSSISCSICGFTRYIKSKSVDQKPRDFTKRIKP